MEAETIITLTSLMQHGNTACVTGASSGIGKAACVVFAQAGMNVWMVDIDAKELMEAQKYVKGEVASANKFDDQLILAEIVDVSDAVAVETLAQQIFEATGKLHILMNNAGIGLGGDAVSTPLDVMHRVMNVNLFGPIHGCVSFIPRMKASKESGIIINTGSKQGITMPPGNLTYNTSKAALKCYTEGLEHELMKERLAGTARLRAVLLIPGWVNTSIALKSERAKALAAGTTYKDEDAFFSEQNPQAGAWMPIEVVKFMKQEVDKGRFYIICPDNDVDRETDNLRMTWTMQDIVKDRPPLSRWHPDYKDQFETFMQKSKKK